MTGSANRTIVLLTASLLLLLLSGCADEEPLSPAPFPPSMKGYELYSWKAGRELRFTLITGTNRLKTMAELTSRDNSVEDDWVKVTVRSVSALKDALDLLPSGTHVVWWGARDLPCGSILSRTTLELPPGPLVDEVKARSSELGISLEISEE